MMPKKYEEIGNSEAARLFYSFSHTVLGGIGRLILGFRVEGEENIPKAGPGILASNHLGGPDTIYVPIAIPDRHVVVIGRQGIMDRPVQGRIFKAWGAQAIQRTASDQANRRESINDALEIMKKPLQEGRLELVFSSPPTRLPGKKPSRPIGAITRLARETGSPVIPTVIKGSDRLLEERGVTVKFGPPLYHPGNKLYDREFKNLFFQTHRQLFDSIPYNFEYGEPPAKINLEPDV